MQDFNDIVATGLSTFSDELEAWQNPVDNCGYKGLPRNVINANLNKRRRKDEPEHLITREQETEITHKTMFAFLQEVATKNPHLTFIGRSAHLEHVVVVVGEEVLGRINENYDRQLKFENNRIRDVLTRGNGKKTGKIPIAIKLFNKFFYPATVLEKAKFASDDLASSISSAWYGADRELNKPKNHIKGLIASMLQNNSQAFARFLTDVGELEILKEYQECSADFDNIHTIREDAEKGRGIHVFRVGDKWGISDAHRKITSATTKERVPDELIGNFAMLKTVEDNTFIQQVGYKQNENSYWIYKENDDD